MASEVGGLDPLHGYMKHGNLVLPIRFPYLNLQSNVAKFVERKLSPSTPPATSPKSELVGSETQEEAMKVEVSKKPPSSVKVSEKRREVVNEQGPHFE
jgi:hypothetical protein